MIREPLKPCPWCGQTPTLHDYTHKSIRSWILDHRVIGCLVRQIFEFPSKEAAIAAWNTRHKESDRAK